MGITTFVIVICIVLALLAMSGFLPTKKRKKKKSYRSPVQGVSQDDWLHLLNICLGDKERAKRLIQAEQKRNPKLSTRKACRLAIERYLKDNR